ncbi:MAG: Fic family protein [Treponema sp.]|nr:Fic family protein [Candidatus Treponema caballi]
MNALYLADNSNHIEGSHLTHDQTRFIFETKTLGITDEAVKIDDILDFHVRFESIHPFQDGNGRIGRLIMFKECLKHNIVPFIITEEIKMFYYRGLKEWKYERGYLRDTCLTGQDAMKEILNHFGVKF